MKKLKYKELVKLKGILLEKKITYQELANNLEMSTSAVSNKINGFSVFTVAEINSICELLQIPIEEIPNYFF